MTVSLTHTFVSAIPDGADTTVVRPSNWNAEHTISMATGKLLGRTTAASGSPEEIGVTAPLSLSALSLSIPVATTLVDGYLSHTDWTTFNNKGSGTVTSVAALTLGTTGTDLTSSVANGTTTPVITLNVPSASASNRGALLAADWSTFNAKQSTITFGTGVQTALGVNIGSAGAPVLFNGAGGTPSSLALANATGLTVPGGGLGVATLGANGVVIGQGASPVHVTAAGTSGQVLTSNGAGVDPTFQTLSGSGTVTSVSFTGGLISVANPTTTPALTVAGTSGGIPYFSGAATWASSAALAANALVIGGGAGAAPATTTTGTGILTFLGTPSSANLAAAVTDETGSGALVFAASPTFTGTLNCAAITPTGLVNISGASAGQIQFPATQNPSAGANTLDDYEEGTWTPVYKAGGATTGVTYANQLGYYTKVGRLVVVEWDFNLSSKGSATGSVSISGLPFDNGRNGGGSMGYLDKMTLVTVNAFYVNLATATVMNPLIDNTANNMADTNVANNSYFRSQYCYSM